MKSESRSKRRALVESDELVGVEKGAAKRWKAVGSRERSGITLLIDGRWTLEDEFKGAVNLFGDIRTGFFDGAVRKGFGLLHGEVTVEEIQGLQRRGAAGALGCGLTSIRAVESSEEVIEHGARFALIHHATKLGRAVVGLGLVNFDVVVVGLEEIEAGAAHFEIELPAGDEHGIAHGFGFETTRREAPEKSRVGIRFVGNFIHGAALLEGLRHQDELVDVFEAPFVRDEFAGEEVEQLGMRGTCSIDSEVAGRLNKAGAEVIMPEAIDDDTRGQRICGIGDPVSEGQTPLLFGCIGGEGEGLADLFQCGGCDDFSRLGGVATMHSICGPRLREIARIDHRQLGELLDFVGEARALLGELYNFCGFVCGHVTEGGNGGDAFSIRLR
jgi:hypothetical protein